MLRSKLTKRILRDAACIVSEHAVDPAYGFDAYSCLAMAEAVQGTDAGYTQVAEVKDYARLAVAAGYPDYYYSHVSRSPQLNGGAFTGNNELRFDFLNLLAESL